MANPRSKKVGKALPVIKPSVSPPLSSGAFLNNQDGVQDFEILSNEDSSLCPCFEKCWCCVKIYRQFLWLRVACAIASVLLIAVGMSRFGLGIMKTFYWRPSTLDYSAGALDLASDPFFSTLGLYLVVIMTEDKATAGAIKTTEDKMKPIFYGAAALNFVFEVCPGVLLMISTVKMHKNSCTAFVFLMGASASISMFQGIFAFILSLRALQTPLTVCKSGNGCVGYILPECSIIFSSIFISCFRVHFFMCGFALYKGICARINLKNRATMARPILPQDSKLSEFPSGSAAADVCRED